MENAPSPHAKSCVVVDDDDDPLMRKLHRQSLALLVQQGLEDKCSLHVTRNGQWYVIKGNVDSHRTRAELFSLVPERDGARWIIDEVSVGTVTW